LKKIRGNFTKAVLFMHDNTPANQTLVT
jgi:hypothetical protein